MKTILIKQAIFIPLFAMSVPIIMAFFLPGYSSTTQHLSELAAFDHPVTTIQRISAILTGISVFLFGLGIFLSSQRMTFTAVVAAAFGASMVSNGIFLFGNPLHGLYGLGIFMVLVPAFFAAEARIEEQSRGIKNFSLLVAILSMTYLWLMLSGFDPVGLRGLTQRVATVLMFSWYSVAGCWLLRHVVDSSRAVQLAEKIEQARSSNAR